MKGVSLGGLDVRWASIDRWGQIIQTLPAAPLPHRLLTHPAAFGSHESRYTT